MSEAPPSHVSHELDVNPTLGAIQVGVLIATMMFGVLTVQTHRYYANFPKDLLITRVLVGFIWVCEFAHSICICHTLYILTITYYGHPESLVDVPLSLPASILFSGFISPLVQSYFALRIYRLSQSAWYPALCTFLSTMRFVGSFAAFVLAVMAENFGEYAQRYEWLLLCCLSVGAGVDVLIGVAMVYYLVRQKSRAFHHTAAVLNKLIAYTIETGLLTSITGMIMLTCYLTMEDNYVWLAFFMFLARLFSISLLASLNARLTLRSNKEEFIEFSTHSHPSKNSKNVSARVVNFDSQADDQGVAFSSKETLQNTV